MESGLALKLLGAPKLEAGGRRVCLSPAAMTLCAYLALSPAQGRPRTVAAAQLFSGCPEPAARRRLNTAIWRLRCEIRGQTEVDLVCTSQDHTVRLSPAAHLTIDASVFEHTLEPLLAKNVADLTEHDAVRLGGALSMHHGHLLESCDDDWVLVAREHIENLYLAALDHLVQFHGAHGDISLVSRYGELALALEPLREDIHRHLMAAYGAADRMDLVERQFERCRVLLVEELGTDPMPETLGLYSRLTHGDQGYSPTVAALASELERARRDITRLAATVDRALEALRNLQ